MIQPTPLTGPERRNARVPGPYRSPFIARDQMAPALEALREAARHDLDPQRFRYFDRLAETTSLPVGLGCVGWLTGGWANDVPEEQISTVWLPPDGLANYAPAPDDWLMPVLAPFVSAGATITIRTDAGDGWRWDFDGTAAQRYELPWGAPRPPRRPPLLRRLRSRIPKLRLFGPVPGDTVRLRRPVWEERDGRQVELPAGAIGRLDFYNGPRAAVTFDIDPHSYWIVDKRDLR